MFFCFRSVSKKFTAWICKEKSLKHFFSYRFVSKKFFSTYLSSEIFTDRKQKFFSSRSASKKFILTDLKQFFLYRSVSNKFCLQICSRFFQTTCRRKKMKVFSCGRETALIRLWYGPDTALIRLWYGPDTGLIRPWYGPFFENKFNYRSVRNFLAYRSRAKNFLF